MGTAYRFRRTNAALSVAGPRNRLAVPIFCRDVGDTRAPLSRVSLIVNGRRSITADTAMRLARSFETSAQMWMSLQTAYDLGRAEEGGGHKEGSDPSVQSSRLKQTNG